METATAPKRVRSAEWISASHQALARAVQSGFGLAGIVSALSTALSTPVCVVDTRGSVLASVPSRAEWDVESITAWRPDGNDIPGEFIVPLRLSDETVALLCARIDVDHGGVCAFAANLIATDLGWEQARLEGRRELSAQVLDDFFAARVSDHDASRRLVDIGVQPEEGYRVLIGQVQAPLARIRSIPWNLHTIVGLGQDPYVRAIVDGQVVLVVPASTPVHALARITLQHLSALGPDAKVGIGGSYAGLSGLRLSYFHARTAAASKAGITDDMNLNLGSLLLLANLGLPLKELSGEVLKPLLTYDSDNHGELVHTLETFLRLDCSNQRTAAELFIHRNTLRYRLGQIESLTGRSLGSFQNRMHFWIAVIGARSGSHDNASIVSTVSNAPDPLTPSLGETSTTSSGRKP